MITISSLIVLRILPYLETALPEDSTSDWVAHCLAIENVGGGETGSQEVLEVDMLLQSPPLQFPWFNRFLTARGSCQSHAICVCQRVEPGLPSKLHPSLFAHFPPTCSRADYKVVTPTQCVIPSVFSESMLSPVVAQKMRKERQSLSSFAEEMHITGENWEWKA